MKILVAGGSGLVGAALRGHWAAAGHEVVQLVRRQPILEDAIFWDPAAGILAITEPFECDAVVNLAGENIASGRWTRARRERIRSSRLDTSQLLATSIVAGRLRPQVWINASAIGVYGNSGETIVDESSPEGQGFLASVCGEWERAVGAVADVGIRVVNLRLGVVLDPRGGALGKLLPIFRRGLGGRVGNGRMWMSWISSAELARVVDEVLRDKRYSGPVNAVTPEPVRNVDFAAALGRALSRPAVIPMPAWLVRVVFGAMGRETILASQRVNPRVLLEGGFSFGGGGIAGALEAMRLRHQGGSDLSIPK